MSASADFYASVLGMPLQDYRSEMAVTGDDACELIWRSTCHVAPGNAAFIDELASILAGGANEIADKTKHGVEMRVALAPAARQTG